MPPVAQVGRYLLLKRLGQGGMGVVYSAYDPDLDRKVALKLLQADGRSSSEAGRARLLREAQAMARVSHPNVIPVFDVGVWDDQVFLAMELADGGALSGWLEEEHSWREVLERFLGAGRGLLAAHEAGLVHRDFKPANVLVGGAGRVWVTDFGLARPMDGTAPEALPEEVQDRVEPERRLLEANLTQQGVVLGTPNYMSPEQYRGGELDSRSDQFSFCVSLYYGLYRKRPFESARMRAFAATSRPVSRPEDRTEPVQGLSTPPPADIIQEPPRDTKVPGWVRQALMRGLALHPADRFGSMKELLEALSQERRRASRQRWVAAAGMVGVGLAVVGGAVWRQSQVCADAGEPMARVWTPAARGSLATAFQATGTPLASEVAERVSQVLDGYAADWKRQRTQVCEATHKEGTQPEELLGRRVACLERRREDMRALVGVLGEADASVMEKAVDAAHALPELRECADLEGLAEQQRLPSDPDKRARVVTLGTGLAEVRALLDAGRYKAAWQKAEGLEAPVRASGHLPLAAELSLYQGVLQGLRDKSTEAVGLLSRALHDAEAGRADRLKVAALNQLLFVEDGQKHFDQAEGWGGLALATVRRMGGNPMLEAEVLVNEANLALSRERYPEARALLERARGLQEKVLPEGDPRRARVTYTLGRAMMDLGERKQAVVLFDEALRQTAASVGPRHPDMARRHLTMSWALRELGEFPRALEHAQAMLDIRQALFGRASFEVAEALDELGMGLLGLKRYEEALKVYEEALAIKREQLEADDEQLQYSYDGVGQALLGLGRAREAVAPLRQAVTFASAPPDVLADSGFALAKALWSAGDQPEARTEAARARERFTEAKLAPRVGEVDAWLGALPPEAPTPSKRPARPPRPVRRPARH